MHGNFNCWHCGKALKGIPLPFGRREDCPACGASLHVCRMCTFYDPAVSKDCREPMADEVGEKEAANFCDYFNPMEGLTGGSDREAAEARARLEAVFGDPGATPRESEAEAARRKLQSLFGDPEDE